MIQNVKLYSISDMRAKLSILVFRPKLLKNHTLWGGTYQYSSYSGVPPSLHPPPREEEGSDFREPMNFRFLSFSMLFDLQQRIRHQAFPGSSP